MNIEFKKDELELLLSGLEAHLNVLSVHIDMAQDGDNELFVGELVDEENAVVMLSNKISTMMDKLPEFKVGDEVRIIELLTGDDCVDIELGDTFKLVEVDKGLVRVKLPDGNSWWLTEYQIVEL